MPTAGIGAVTHRLLPIQAHAVSAAGNGTFQLHELLWLTLRLGGQGQGTARWTDVQASPGSWFSPKMGISSPSPHFFRLEGPS